MILLTPIRQWASKNRGAVIFFTLLLIAFVALRTTPSGVTPDELETLVTRGQPTVLEFYSNF
jgi:hypothetical protein